MQIVECRQYLVEVEMDHFSFVILIEYFYYG
jgi:hypothetical protein